MTDRQFSHVSRRTFVKRAAAGSLAALAMPAIVTADKSGGKKPVVGAGEHQYEVDHQFAKLPGEFTWQTTHNVAVGGDGTLYVIHEGRLDQPDHPAIFAFDPAGKYIRSFGHQFQGGGHGLETRREGNEEFLYVTAYQQKRSFAKLTTAGETVWHNYAPMEAGGYAAGEDVSPRKPDDNPWGRNRFHPTNFAFLADGGFLLADGYGSFRIHRYDASGKYLSSFGQPSGESKADGTFQTPHGLWIDDRSEPGRPDRGEPGRPDPGEPLIVVTDRANARLQWFTLEGEHRQTQDGFLLPANADVQGDLLLIPDLVGRVTLLDGNNDLIAHLGDDSQRMGAEQTKAIRGDESQWIPGKFVHPHDACFDSNGNIFVAEWVQRGRITKLTKKS